MPFGAQDQQEPKQRGKSSSVRNFLKKARPSRKGSSSRATSLSSSGKHVCEAENSDKIVCTPGDTARLTVRPAMPLDPAGLEVVPERWTPGAIGLEVASDVRNIPFQNLTDRFIYGRSHSEYSSGSHGPAPPGPSTSDHTQSASPATGNSRFSPFQKLMLFIAGVFIATWLWDSYATSGDTSKNAPSALLIGRDTPVIAIMGASGSGKSSFIHALGGRDKNGLLPEIGHGLQSCTKNVDWYTSSVNGQPFYIVDTPGFDDTVLSDSVILKQLAAELVSIYREHRPLTGLIYLHDISKVKMERASNNLETFHQLAGDKSLKNVILATTHWPAANSEYFKSAQAREKELRSSFWKHMISKGSSISRLDGSKKSAQKMITQLLKKAPVKVQIVEELVNKKKSLDKTAAGKTVDKGLGSLQEKMQHDVNEIRQQLKEEMERSTREHAAKLDAERAKEKAEREEEVLKRMAEEKKEKLEREKIEEKLEKMTKLLEKSRQEKDGLRSSFQGSSHNGSPSIILGHDPTLSGLIGLVGVLSWLAESLFTIFGLIQAFNVENDAARGYAVLHSVYWGLFSYIFFKSGQSTPCLFIVVCQVIYRLLKEALRQGFVAGVDEGSRTATQEIEFKQQMRAIKQMSKALSSKESDIYQRERDVRNREYFLESWE